jgi:hypothetical protein
VTPLTHVFDVNSMPAKRGERRGAPRKRRTARLQIAIWQNADNLVDITVQAIDISRAGLGLACPIPMTRGEYFVLTTTRDKHLYRVVRCWPAGKEYRVGAAREMSVGLSAEPSHLNQIKKLLNTALDPRPLSAMPAPICIF